MRNCSRAFRSDLVLSPEKPSQHFRGTIVNAGRGTLARPRDVEHANPVRLGPGPYPRYVNLRADVNDQAGLFLPPGQLDGQGGAAVGLPARQDQRAVGVAHVPLGPLRIAVPRRLLKGIAVVNAAVLGAAPLWTPAPTRHSQFQRHIEGGAIHTGLPARDDFGNHDGASS